MKRGAVLVMAKRPAPGRTKTRLTPPLTPQQAADLYECFLLDVLAIVRQTPGVVPFAAISPPDAGDYFRRLAPDFDQIPQLGETLGQRLDHVLSHCLDRGFGSVIALSSDSPTLPPAYLEQAFTALDEGGVDLVLGPCDDGGYYLIGLKTSCPRLTLDVRMSTPDVLQDTLAIAREEGLQTALLPSWYDVDSISDLHRLQDELAHAPAKTAVLTRRFLQRLLTMAGPEG